MLLPHDVMARPPRCLVIENTVDLFVDRQRGFAHVTATRRRGRAAMVLVIGNTVDLFVDRQRGFAHWLRYHVVTLRCRARVHLLLVSLFVCIS
jgi:hypothetical protein